jgi:hypothetical protein
MDAPKGKPALRSCWTARGMLQGVGIGAGRERKEAGRSPSVLPYGSPPFRGAPNQAPFGGGSAGPKREDQQARLGKPRALSLVGILVIRR